MKFHHLSITVVSGLLMTAPFYVLADDDINQTAAKGTEIGEILAKSTACPCVNTGLFKTFEGRVEKKEEKKEESSQIAQ